MQFGLLRLRFEGEEFFAFGGENGGLTSSFAIFHAIFRVLRINFLWELSAQAGNSFSPCASPFEVWNYALQNCTSLLPKQVGMNDLGL